MRRSWFVAGLSLGGLVCTFTFVLVYRLAVTTTRGRTLDGAALNGALQTPSAVADQVARVLNLISVGSLVVAAVFIVAIALVRMRHSLALAAIVVLVGANVTSQLLKTVLRRPDLGLDEITPARLNSMPSGHSTVALSVAVALVMVLPARARPAAAVAGVAYASVTGVATLLAGWHRPSDAVAGFLVVGAWASLAGLVTVAVDDSVLAPYRLERHETTAFRLGVVGVGLIGFAACLAGLLVLTTDKSTTTLARLAAYVAGSGAVTGTALIVMSALLVAVPCIAPRSQRLGAPAHTQGEE